MNKYLILSILFLLVLSTSAQVGIQTNSPDASSALDIVASDKGLLIPRVTLTTSLSSASPVTSPATGLLVFNTGANQAVGLYFWDGSSWNLFNAGSISSDYWNLSGNAGTTVGTDFIGTTDAEDFAIYTNNNEAMRINDDSQVLIGLTTANFASDFVTIEANATQNYGLNISSPYVGAYVDGTDYGVYGIGGTVAVRGSGGTYGVYATGTSRGVLGRVDANPGSGGWFENQNVDGWGALFVGSGLGTGYTLTNHSAGLSSSGDDGIFATGKATDGHGIIAGGNAVSTFSTLPLGAGGAFTGYHGVYGSAVDATAGTGVIGVGNDHGTYNTIGTGSGGAFTGYNGLISTAYDASGTGVIGVGNGGSYVLFSGGSGGAFTGDVCGVAGYTTLAGTNRYGVYGLYNGGGNYNAIGVYGYSRPRLSRGIGVYGIGNKYGVFGYQGTTGSTNYGVYANGNMGASGTKSFAIDHPLDPENKILKHYSIESPEVLNMYRGNVVLDNNGEASIQLPDYFLEININFSYDLTAIGQKAPDLYIQTEIDGNGVFTISGGNSQQKISWVVYAERNDHYMRQADARAVEIEKDELEKGKYLMPELYDQPAEKGIFYEHENSADHVIKQRTVSNKSVKVTAEEIKSEKLDPIDKNDKK